MDTCGILPSFFPCCCKAGAAGADDRIHIKKHKQYGMTTEKRLIVHYDDGG
jgi:hypothetical protein